jgi:23S rRNA (uracil1939-C5)-methyltransferase
MADEAKTVIGVDIEETAVADAKQNAAVNGITNAEFHAIDAGLMDETAFMPDCVVVDPPRGGLGKEAITKITGMKPSRIVYVSCDPATLARDARLFEGFKPVKLCAVDMFPRTAHVECVMLLDKS